MHAFYLREKANVLEAAVFLPDNIFWYLIIFIDFLAIESLLTSILLSCYCEMGVLQKSLLFTFSDKIYLYKYQNALVFKFWKFWLYNLLKTLLS